MNDPLLTTLVDAVDLFHSQGMDYALVGGLAASLRGQPRATADVDLVVIVDVERALAIAGGLNETNFKPLFDGIEEIVQQAFILPLRHRTTGVKVDVALGLSGFEQQLVARAERVQLAECRVAVATAEDLVIMKTLAARPQDEQDVRGIVAAQGDGLDWEYCLRVAADLGEAVGQDLAGRIQVLRQSPWEG